MPIEDVIQRATINFRGLFTVGEVEGMFLFWKKYGDLNTAYEVRENKQVEDAMEEHAPPVSSSVAISGTVTKFDLQIHDRFECIPGYIINPENHLLTLFHSLDPHQFYFQGLKFEIRPGKEIEQYPPLVINLWDKVRKLTKDYDYELEASKRSV